MKAFFVIVAMAAVACGGASSSLSNQEARSIAAQVAAALPDGASSGASRQLVLSGSVDRSVACAGGGDVTVDGSLTINCPTWRTCTTNGSLTVAASACTTDAGVQIDGSLSATVSGKGIILSITVTGDLQVTRPDEPATTCAVNLTVTAGSQLSGQVCGVPIS